MLAAVLAAGLFLFPAVGAAAKQAMAPIAIVLGVALLAATLWADRRVALPSRAVALLFAAFTATVVAWHLPPALGDGGSAATVGKLAVLAVVLWLCAAGWAGLLDPPRLTRIARWAFAGLALGSAFLLIELLGDSPFHRLIDGIGPEVVVDPARHNRPAVALLLVSLPVAGLLARRVGPRAALAALALGLAPAALGQSAAAWMAILAATVVFLAARRWPGAVLLVGGVLTAGFVVAAPPLLSTAYRIAVERKIAMPLSFADRLEIWDHAAGEIRKAPWLGTGLGSVRHLPMTDEQRARYRYHKAPANHAHNAAMQVWVEFGAVGIAAGLTLLGLGAAAIRRMERAARPMALGTAAALLVVAMLSFGLWQETWLGLIGVTVVLVRLAALPAAAEGSS